MTVNTTKITSGPYVGNGVASTFSYTFKVEDKTQLKVFETTDAGAETILVVGTDYTVAGVGNDGGGIITRVAGALPTDFEWFIRSDYEETQLTAFSSQGAFFPEIHENAMDKITLLIQQLLDEKNRSPKVSNSYTGALPLSMDDPVAGKFLIWKNDLSGLINAEPAILDPDIINRIDLILTTDNVAGLANLGLVVGQRAETRGYRTVEGGGAADYLVVSDLAPDGKFNHDLGGGLTAKCISQVTLKRLGAFGDYDILTNTGTDDSDVIEFFFEFLQEYTGSETGFSASWEAEMLYAKTIKAEAGVYLLTRSITRGTGGVIYYQNVEFENGAYIYCNIPTPTATQYGINIHQLENCDIKIGVRSKTCGALLYDSAKNCGLDSNVGTETGEAAMRYQGIHFNNVYNNKFNQNVQNSSIGVSPNTWALRADFTVTSYNTWSGMVVCKFATTFISGAGKGIRLLGGGIEQSPVLPGPVSQVSFELLELEGTDGIALEVTNFNQLTISNQWTEATGGTNAFNTLSFDNGIGLTLNSTKVGEIRDDIKIKDVDAITLNNFEGGGALHLEGDIRGLTMVNPRFKATKTRDMIIPDSTSTLYDLQGLNITNPMLINGDGSFSAIRPNIVTTGALSQEKNYIKDPSGITESTYNRCSFLSNSPSSSPLGIAGQVIRLNGSGDYPWLDLNLSDSLPNFSGYVISAWLPNSPADATFLETIGVENANGVVAAQTQFFGDWVFYQDGWMIAITYVNISAGTGNKLRLVFNYNDFGPDGRTWDFGGAMLFDGNLIGLPK